MGSPEPAAFLSYVRADDQHEGGLISQFRERLSAEVRMQIGQDFPIFQDRNDIAWGQNWQTRIDETLDTVTLLIPVMTPGFFESVACRQEVTRFLDRERQLGRSDLMRETFWRPPPRVGQREQGGAAKPTTGTAQALPGGAEGFSVVKNEPPTHVVDPLHRGDFLTITAAIQAARPGDRILVRPGLYRESVVLDKPLEIIGQGAVEEIVVQIHDAHVLLFRANIGRVTNLTLRQLGGKDAWSGVDIDQGRLELEGCDITSRSGPCITIHDGADPRLRRNRIHDGKEGGVLVYEDGLGTLEDNDITGNTLAGVEIRTGGNPTLRRNRINRNNYVAVRILEGGGGVVEDNDLSNNARGAWDIAKDSSDKVSRVRNKEG